MSATVADIDMTAKGLGPAIDEIPDDAPVAVRHGFSEPIQIATTVAAQYVCHRSGAVCLPPQAPVNRPWTTGRP